MSAENLRADIDKARSRHQEANKLLSEAKDAAERLRTNRAIGRMTESVWKDHFDARVRAGELEVHIPQTSWKDPDTGRSLEPRRSPDNYVRGNSMGTAVEIKGSPEATKSATARRQLALDQSRINQGALLGNRDTGLQEVHNSIVKGGLPILGDGGNTALPGERPNRHVIIVPDSPTAPPTNSSTQSPTAPIVDTAGETPSGGVLRGADKFLGPAGHLLDGYSLYEAYNADGGFGENFRETAGGIAGGAAGGWGGAAAGAALGTAIFPGVGTVVGGIAGGIAGGIGGEKIGEILGGLF